MYIYPVCLNQYAYNPPTRRTPGRPLTVYAAAVPSSTAAYNSRSVPPESVGSLHSRHRCRRIHGEHRSGLVFAVSLARTAEGVSDWRNTAQPTTHLRLQLPHIILLHPILKLPQLWTLPPRPWLIPHRLRDRLVNRMAFPHSLIHIIRHPEPTRHPFRRIRRRGRVPEFRVGDGAKAEEGRQVRETCE